MYQEHGRQNDRQNGRQWPNGKMLGKTVSKIVGKMVDKMMILRTWKLGIIMLVACAGQVWATFWL